MADGNIVAEKVRLKHAIAALVDKRPAVYHDATVYQPSLYASLRSDLAGTQGDTRTPAKSLPPIWIDACMLLECIDNQAHKWMPVPGDTPVRLRLLSGQSFRPQDCDHVKQIVGVVDGWRDSIINMLEPASRKFISADCPSCGRGVVYRRDSAGESVRQPALKWTQAVGFECQACKAHWAPEQTLFFSRLLGFELPEGVLE